jgi:DNA-directed RNA polymerase subunit RPC12/RpoP
MKEDMDYNVCAHTRFVKCQKCNSIICAVCGKEYSEIIQRRR